MGFVPVLFRISHEGSVCAAVKAVAAVITDEVMICIFAGFVIACAVIDVLLSVFIGENL